MQSPDSPSQIQLTSQSIRDRIAIAKRSPVRVTITINHGTHERLITISTAQGRSVSNLCAFLLEASLEKTP